MKKLFVIGILLLQISCQLLKPRGESTPTASAILTPTEALTHTPTVTASPALPATATPMFFTEEFDTDMGAWTSFQTGGMQPAAAALENDSLNIEMTSPNTWYYAVRNAHEYSGVFISAKFSGAPSGSLGLVCNYSEANGWYEFNLTHEGAFSVLLGKWLAEGIAEYRPILNNTSEYLQTGNMSYEIGLTCNHNTLFLHINGKMFQKLDVTRFGLTQGKIGIAAASFDNVPMNATFEWVKVSPPEW